MNMKQFKQTLLNYADYKTADTVNHEGFPAWQRKGLERLREILFLGHTGNTFYVKANKKITEMVSDLEQLIVDSNIPAKKIAELIVAARQEGLFRTIPILALVLLRRRDPQQFKEIFTDVILTGNDLKDFLDLNRIVFTGYGRAVKTAIHNWLKNKVNEFYALKYRNQIADAIAISRPKVDAYENKWILKYVYGIKKNLQPETLQQIYANHRQIEAAEKFKAYVREGLIDRAIEIAQEARLPADLMIGLLGDNDDPKIWRVIVQHMGLMQFLKYINKLTRIGLVEEVVAAIRERLTPENIRKAKIFPYRVFVAWLYAMDERVKDALANVLNMYEREKLLDEVWTKYSYAIAPDISASMTWSPGNGVTPAHIAGFFSSLLAKQLNVDEILAWDTKVCVIPTKDRTLFELYSKIAEAEGGGTAMAEPINYLTQNKRKVDIVIIITDEQHWCGMGPKTAWRRYKETVNPDAKLAVIEVVGYGHSITDEEFAQQYDVYTVFGWTESVFKWIEMKVLS